MAQEKLLSRNFFTLSLQMVRDTFLKPQHYVIFTMHKRKKETRTLKLFSNIFQLQVVLIEIIRLCSLEYNKCVYIILALVFASMS